MYSYKGLLPYNKQTLIPSIGSRSHKVNKSTQHVRAIIIDKLRHQIPILRDKKINNIETNPHLRLTAIESSISFAESRSLSA